MKDILVIILFSMILNPVITNAQVTQEWVATYNGVGTGYNFPMKSAVDNLGNYIIAGNSNGIGGYDYVVLKYTPSGNLIWSQRYNGIGNGYDYLSGMVLDDSGNVYVTGSSDEGTSNGSVNWVTIKYSANGQMMWKKSLNWIANGIDESFGMTTDKNKNIYVTGYGKTDNVHRQMITIKYNFSGDSLWTQVYRTNPNTHDWGYSLAADDSLNIYTSGYGVLPVNNEIVTIKYDQSGNEKWIKKWPTNYGDYLRPTYSAVDNENDIVVVGYSYISNNYDFVTLKYSSNGILLWSRNFAGISDDFANSIFLDKNDNILIGGSLYSTGFSDYLILKYAPNGDTLLIKLIDGGGLNSDQVNSIVSDSSENIYVTGFSQSAGGVEHYLTVKMNSSGDTLWTKTYRNAYSNSAYCINLDNNGSVYVSGAGGSPGGNSGIVSIKYSQLNGISSEFSETLSYQLSNYPNPFNPITKIKFVIPKNGFIKLILFDITGRETENLLNEYKKEGQYYVSFISNNYSSGVYFYSLIVDGKPVKTNKMIIMR